MLSLNVYLSILNLAKNKKTFKSYNSTSYSNVFVKELFSKPFNFRKPALWALNLANQLCGLSKPDFYVKNFTSIPAGRVSTLVLTFRIQKV